MKFILNEIVIRICYFPYRTVLYTILITLVAFLLFVQLLRMKAIKKFQNFTQCFHYEQTLSSLVDYKSKNDDISCFHGLKTFACLSVIMFHSLLWPVLSYLYQNNDFSNDIKFTVAKEAMMSTTVEPFFVMSAILLTRNVLKSLKG